MGRFDALTQLEETPEKKASLLTNQQTSKLVSTQPPQEIVKPTGKYKISPESTPQNPEEVLDSSLLTTKEKTKYGTYLTAESIEKISIRAIQTKRDAHQVVQEAVNKYFAEFEK
jgi:hypothetical protein